MAFVSGTATDYQDLLDQLVEIATSDSVSAAAINAGGTGYAVDDILTVSGGTSTHAAKLRVTSVASGVIDGIAVEEGGAYTSVPSNPVSVTGGSGSSATFNLTSGATGWTALRNNPRFDQVAPSAGGTGYTAGDLLTVSGGTSSVPAVLEVETVSSGVITSVSLRTKGVYTALPSSPFSVTGGTGSGATFSYQSEKEVILEGEGGGSDEIFVGIRSYENVGASAHNWDLHGFTGYTASLDYDDQPGRTLGGYDDETTVDTQYKGSIVLLENASLNFWICVDAYRIVGAVKIGSSYESFYLGFLSAFTTTAQSPYPMFICGSTPMSQSRYTTTRTSHSSIADPRGRDSTVDRGPGQVRVPGGSWQDVMNAAETNSGESSISNMNTCVVWPTGSVDVSVEFSGSSGVTARGAGYSGSHTTDDYKDPVSDNPTFQLRPTPDSPDDSVALFPCMIYGEDIFYGEISGVYWFSAYGTLIAAEDEIVQGSGRYIVFQSGPRTAETALWAMKKA